MSSLVIAIDGPAGSGKSTTARMVAEQLGLLYLDTGAMYRAITLKALRTGTPLTDGARLRDLAASTELRFVPQGGEQRLFMDGEDVTEEIRRPDVTAGTTPVSQQREVREVLVRLQKKIGDRGGVVAEGRDTTSVVFPDADLKIYLTASEDVRAARRVIDLKRLGIESSLAEQIELLAKRDRADSTREASPLMRVEGVIEIDTTALSIDQQVQRIIDLAHQVAAV